MDRTERIEIRLTPTEKQEIDDYLDDEGAYTDRSQMFRSLAKKEIRGDDTATIDAKEIVNAVEIAFSDLTENVEQVNDRLADVEQKLRQSEDDIDSLAHDLYDEMIEVGSEEQMRNLEPGLRMPSEEAAIVSTPQIWAEFFNEDLVDVRRALGRALEYYPDLKYLTTDDGHRRYYILDPSIERWEGQEGGA